MMYFLIFLSLLVSCNITKEKNFKLKQHSLHVKGRTHPNYLPTRKKFALSPIRATKFAKHDQDYYERYLKIAMEKRGHQFSPDPRKADIVLLYDFNRSGPFQIERTAINHLWTNYVPFINAAFEINRVDAQATYNYLKEKRGIKDWKKRKEKFNFEYDVYLSRLRLRAIEYVADESPRIAWETWVTTLGEKKRDKAGWIASVAGSYDLWETQNLEPQYRELPDSDERIFDLYEKVVAENAYTTTKKDYRLYEEYRNLKTKELMNYYIERKEQYDLNPLYESKDQ